jgi:hypothetical protein
VVSVVGDRLGRTNAANASAVRSAQANTPIVDQMPRHVRVRARPRRRRASHAVRLVFARRRIRLHSPAPRTAPPATARGRLATPAGVRRRGPRPQGKSARHRPGGCHLGLGPHARPQSGRHPLLRAAPQGAPAELCRPEALGAARAWPPSKVCCGVVAKHTRGVGDLGMARLVSQEASTRLLGARVPADPTWPSRPPGEGVARPAAGPCAVVGNPGRLAGDVGGPCKRLSQDRGADAPTHACDIGQTKAAMDGSGAASHSPQRR